MSSLQNADWLDDVLVFLVAAGIVVPFLHRARLGSVLGFLLVGVIIGPYGLGRLQYTWHWIVWVTIEDPENVTPFADWGVVFLLFLIGLEVSVGRLWELRRYVFGAGALQVAVCTAVIAALLHQLGLPRMGSIILGLSLAQSSTAIVMQILVEQGRAATPLGHVALAVLLFQDLMVIPTLFVTGMDHAGGFTWATLSITLAQGVAAIIGILLIGQFVLRPLLHLVVKTGSRDLIMAITLLLIVGAAGAAGIAGLSTAFGAFLAGLLLSESEYKHQIEIDLEPFKGLLLGLFFMTVGMLLDPLVLLAHAHLIIAGLVGLLIIKAVGFYLASRIFGVAKPIAAELALLLVQAGEFALVTINLARTVGALTEEIAQVADRHRGAVDGGDTAARHFGAAAGRAAWRRRTRRTKPDQTGQSHQPCDHQRLWPGRPGDREDARGRARALRGVRHRCRRRARAPQDQCPGVLRRHQPAAAPAPRRRQACLRVPGDGQRRRRGRTDGASDFALSPRRAGAGARP